MKLNMSFITELNCSDPIKVKMIVTRMRNVYVYILN